MKRWGLEWVIDQCWNCDHEVDEDMEADVIDDELSAIWNCPECDTENDYRRYIGDA